MKLSGLFLAAAFLSATVINSLGQSAIGDVKLTLRRSAPGLELSWPATLQKSDGSIVQPYFELQRSADLQRWQPMGERQRAAAATPGQLLGVTLGTDEPHAFYRLLSIQPSNVAKLGSGGAEVFGYGDAFAQELQRIGQISPDQFAAMFPTPANYLPGLSWDPTTAQFWDQFNADPGKVNEGKNGTAGFSLLRRTFERRGTRAFQKERLCRQRAARRAAVSPMCSTTFGTMTCRCSFPATRCCKPGIAPTTPCSRKSRKPIFSTPCRRCSMGWPRR